MQRIRIYYQKGMQLQYTGNLDMHKVWERTFRRAQLNLAYSQGFHPQPKLQQAAPLPLGFTSRVEQLDVWLDSNDSISEISRKLIQTAQPGIKIDSIEDIPIYGEALPNLVQSADYLVTCDETLEREELQARIDVLLGKSSIQRERRGKPYDLRPLVLSLEIENLDPQQIKMRLSLLPSATGRPEEVLEELGIDPFTTDIERTQLVLKKG